MPTDKPLSCLAALFVRLRLNILILFFTPFNVENNTYWYHNPIKTLYFFAYPFIKPFILNGYVFYFFNGRFVATRCIMNKIFSFVCIVTFLISCSKNNSVDAPLPLSKANLSRTFFYPDNNSSEVASYTSSNDEYITKNTFYNSEGALLMRFDAAYPNGNDGVSLSIAKEKLKPGLVGDYVIAPFLQVGAPEGDVRAMYIYNKSEASTTILMAGTSTGSLQITAYNKQKNLISGQYNFQLQTNQDPKGGPVVIWRNTTVTVRGSFENVLIQPE